MLSRSKGFNPDKVLILIKSSLSPRTETKSVSVTRLISLMIKDTEGDLDLLLNSDDDRDLDLLLTGDTDRDLNRLL